MLSGGLGGLGLLFARWAIAEDVEKLTLLETSARAPAHGSLADLQGSSCTTEVTVTSADVAQAEGAALASLSKVDGILHAAGVLRDALLTRQTASSFREVLAGKVMRTLQIDAITI